MSILRSSPYRQRHESPDTKNSPSVKDCTLVKKRKVSWGSKSIKKFIKGNSIASQNLTSPIEDQKISESSSDMELSDVEGVIVSNFEPKIRKNATQLIAEFEGKDNEEDLKKHGDLMMNIENHNEKAGFNDEMQKSCRPFADPKYQKAGKCLLTPVKEESESIHSSGDLIEKVTKTQPFCRKLNLENPSISSKDQINNNIYPIVSLKNLQWTFPPIPKLQKLNTITCDRYNLSELKNKLIQCKNDEKTISDNTEKYLKKLKTITQNIEETNKLYANFQNFLNEISSKTLKSGEIKAQDLPPRKRWSQTYIQKFNNGSITYYKHNEFLLDHPLLKRLIIFFDNRGGRDIIGYNLYKFFDNKDIQTIFHYAFEDYKRRLEILERQDILEKISEYWIRFLRFSENFEAMQLAFGYEEIEFRQSKFVLKGSIFRKNWVYELTYAEIDTNWDIVTSVGKEIQGTMTSSQALLN
ncbi:hypothetical protein SteCoe_3091 [Stentor coeruleus]|uniref:Uncharacterized protein n=1 Tax=Stentor coeruleus TaxID=5963 RepID=A0A1R2CY14_9CILI|nr:hypothetical protein SteCoe_3091 [Stentor coeruleus]